MAIKIIGSTIIDDGRNIVNAGIVTATSFFGDGSNLTGITAGVGINSGGVNVGYGATVLDFRGTGISTVTLSSGIGTIYIEGGSGSQGVTGVTGVTGPAGLSGFTSVIERVFTSGTSYTPTTGASYFVVYCTGGGGGGGNAAGTDTSNSNAGGGGGAGGTAIKIYNAAEMGSGAVYAVGAGGNGGTSSGSSGGTGGTSTFNPNGTGLILTANGGTGGEGSSTGNNTNYRDGGDGGTTTNGDINAKGQSGFHTQTVNAFAGGGNGGASYYGGGGGGGFVASITAGDVGGTASTFGAGGGGGASRGLNNTGSTGINGGSGSDGAIVIFEYIV